MNWITDALPSYPPRCYWKSAVSLASWASFGSRMASQGKAFTVPHFNAFTLKTLAINKQHIHWITLIREALIHKKNLKVDKKEKHEHISHLAEFLIQKPTPGLIFFNSVYSFFFFYLKNVYFKDFYTKYQLRNHPLYCW